MIARSAAVVQENVTYLPLAVVHGRRPWNQASMRLQDQSTTSSLPTARRISCAAPTRQDRASTVGGDGKTNRISGLMTNQPLEDLHTRWAAAMRSSDVDALVASADPEYVLWASGTPPLEGAGALRSLLETTFARLRVESVFECEELVVDGRLAVERGWDVQRIQHRDGGEVRTRRQRVTIVTRLGDDGEG